MSTVSPYFPDGTVHKKSSTPDHSTLRNQAAACPKCFGPFTVAYPWFSEAFSVSKSNKLSARCVLWRKCNHLCFIYTAVQELKERNVLAQSEMRSDWENAPFRNAVSVNSTTRRRTPPPGASRRTLGTKPLYNAAGPSSRRIVKSLLVRPSTSFPQQERYSERLRKREIHTLDTSSYILGSPQ